MKTTGEGVTTLLLAVHQGRPGAADELLALVYAELHGIARKKMTQVPRSDTLQPTALVHEAYLRLFGKTNPTWANRRHFFFAAARAMHDILVEQARRHAARKRGGNRERIDLDEGAIVASQSEELLALNEAIERLEAIHPRVAKIVMLRFFGGLKHDEVARTLETSSATVRRDWTFAKAWLRDALGEVPQHPDPGKPRKT